MVDMQTGVLRGALGGGAALNKNFEPQRTSNAIFRVSLGTVGGGDAGVLAFSVATMPLPKSSNGIIEVGFFNEKRKFAGNAVHDDLQFAFIDYLDLGTVKTLQAWRYQVYNPQTGAVGLAAEYKKTGEIEMFAPNGDDATLRRWKLYGMWPSQFDAGEIDMSGEDVVRCNVTFTVDKCIPDQGINPNGEAGVPN